MTEPAAETTDQERAVAQLQDVLDQFARALGFCQAVGLEPAEALQAAGINIPPMAAGMVNMSLGALATQAEVDSELELQSD